MFEEVLFVHRINHKQYSTVFFGTTSKNCYVFQSEAMTKKNIPVLPFVMRLYKFSILNILKSLDFRFDYSSGSKRIDRFSIDGCLDL